MQVSAPDIKTHSDTYPYISIGPAQVGAHAPAYVIAEAGVNHDGDPVMARELIHAAAEAEADAVKFQVFSAERLVTRRARAAAYQQNSTGTNDQYEMLSRLQLSHDDFAMLSEYAGHCGVEFLATPFSVADLEYLVHLKVRAIKLASPDIVNRPLLEAAAASGLPLILSTGAAEAVEIDQAVALLRNRDDYPLALLHCVSAYPTPEARANLSVIARLTQRYACVSGFSDHTQSVDIGGYARIAGAAILEKHFTLDNNRSGPDHAFSLTPEKMADYIRGVRRAELMLGDGELGLQDEEREVREIARCSVVAVRDIRAGEILHKDMLAVKRPGTGIAPGQLQRLIGRQAKVDIQADAPLQWEALS